MRHGVKRATAALAAGGLLTAGLAMVAVSVGVPPAGAAGVTDYGVTAWGGDANGQLGVNQSPTSGIALPTDVNVAGLAQASVGGTSGVGVDATNNVWTWGSNAHGELGDSTIGGPVQQPSEPGVTPASQVSAGFSFNVALMTNGQVKDWGAGTSDQLGNLHSLDDPVPQTVEVEATSTPLTGITQVAAGGLHTLALASDGTVWAWGDNSSGELGTGNVNSHLGAIHVADGVGGSLSNVIAVAAGEQTSYALKSDGTVWAWGSNQNDAMGDGTTNPGDLFPTEVQASGGGPLTGATAIAAAGQHAIALESDGRIDVWGDNLFGELAQGVEGAATDSTLAVEGETGPATPVGNAVAVAASGDNIFYLDAQGQVFSAGSAAEVGLANQASDSLFVVQSATPPGVVSVSGGPGSVIALSPPQISLQDLSSFAFSATIRSGGTAELLAAVTDNGPGDMSVTSAFTTGTNASDWTVLMGANCTVPVTQGNSCDVHLIFNPSTPGTKTAVLSVLSNGNPVTTTLNGTAFDIRGQNKIAYSTLDFGPNNQIAIANFDGSGETQLTTGTANYDFPAFAPSGQTIAYNDIVEGGPSHIFRQNVDGSGLVDLDGASTCDSTEAAWSPDGTQIAYESDCGTGGVTNLWIMNADGTAQTQLTNAPNGAFRPNWSPDGKQIVYYTGSGATAEIFKIVLNPTRTAIVGNPIPLTSNSWDDQDPVWSPDGLYIAWQSSAANPSNNSIGQIWMMNPDGSNPVEITPNDGSNRSQPAFEPAEGPPIGTLDTVEHLLYTTDEYGAGTTDIGHMDVNPSAGFTGTRSQVTTGGTNRAVASATKSFALTVDHRTTNVSPSQVALKDLTVAPDSPSAKNGTDPNGLPLLNLNLLGPGLLHSLLGLPLLNLNLLGLIGLGPLLNLNLLGLPLLNLNLLGLPLLNLNLLGLPLLNLNLLGLPDGWQSLLQLQGSPFIGQPLNGITLGQVYQAAANSPSTPFGQAFAKITMGDVDWSNSSFATLGVLPLVLGATTFADITPPSGGWCTKFESLGFTNCGSVFGGLTGTPFAFQLANGDLAQLGLNALPVSAFHLPDTGSATTTAPLLNIKLADVQSLLGLDTTPEGSLAVNTLPNPGAVVDCTRVDCTSSSTIFQAAQAGELQPSATFANLGTVASGVWSASSQFGAMPIDEVAFTLMPSQQTPIDDMDLNSLHLPLYGGANTSTLTFHVTDTMPQAPGQASVSVTLPPTFAYMAGTSRFSLSSTVFNGGSVSPLPIGDPTVNGSTLTWTVPSTTIGEGDGVDLSFQAHPGQSPGGFTPSAVFTSPNFTDQTAGVSFNQPAITVNQNMEPAQDTVATAPTLVPDTAYFLTTPAQGIGYFKVPVPTDSSGNPIIGSRVLIRMSHLTNDNDLVVYGIPGLTVDQPFRSSPPGITLNGSPVVAPSLNVPVPDAVVSAATPNPTTPVQTVNDVPLRTDLPVAGVSASRGLYDEEVEVAVPPGAHATNSFTVQVSAYNGSSSTAPYVLHTSVIGVPNLPACAARTFPDPTAGLNSPGAPTAIAPTTQSLFLVSPTRLAGMYGVGPTQAMLNELNNASFLGRPDVHGQIINLDTAPAVQAAFASSDLNPCNVDGVNNVVRAINSEVDSLLTRGQNYTLKSVTIVGSDEVIPQARILDLTDQYNERDNTDQLSFTEQGQDAGGNPTAAHSNALLQSTADGYVLSDSPYGDLAPFSFPGGFVDVPQLAVGRLVETPADIQGAISRFVGANGALDPTTALSAGYDSSGTGQSAVAAGVSFSSHGLKTTVLEDPPTAWSATDLLNAITAAAGGLINLAGHFNHFQSEPDSSSAGPFATTPGPQNQVNLGGIASLAGTGIISMSCHSGLNVPDVLISNPTVAQQAELADWPQAFGAKGAAFEIGSSGFGYADKYAIGYGQQMVVNLAANLKTGVTIGDAMRDAMSQYFGQLGVVGVYDTKILGETNLYGLPMYHIGALATPTPPPPPTPPSGASPTLPAFKTFSATPSFVSHNQGDGTTFFTDGTQSPQLTQDEPIIPKTSIDVTVPGWIATGALLTGLTQGSITGGYAPSISEPIYDTASSQAPLTSTQTIFPAQVQSLQSGTTSLGLTQTLNLLSAQFQAYGIDAAKTVGVLSQYNGLSARVFYQPASDTAAAQDTLPTFQSVVSNTTGGTLNVAATIGPDPTGTTPVQEVLVLYYDGTAWTQLPLTSTDNVHWFGSSAALSSPGQVRFFVQAVKGSGRVGVTTNKAVLFGLPSAAPIVRFTSPANLAVYGVNHKVVATYSCTDALSGAPLTGASCVGTLPNGATLNTSTPQNAGVFTVTATGADGVTTTVLHHYKVVLPAVTITTPPTGAVYIVNQKVLAAYSCGDASASNGKAASCVGTVANGAAINTSTAGVHSLTVTAKNADGATVVVTRQYSVVYKFTGFNLTVKNPPTFNNGVPLIPIPLNFTLRDVNNKVFTGLKAANVSVEFIRVACAGSAVPPVVTPATLTLGPINVPIQGSNLVTVIAPLGVSGTCQEVQMTLFQDPHDTHVALYKF